MAFVIEIELLTGRYDASNAVDRDEPEWPPHPARVFCSLVASATATEDRDALRWLERLPAPVVQAGGVADEVEHRGYVVTNRVEKKGGSQFHPGRSNALRVRHSTIPSTQRVRFVWPDALPDADVAERLDRLARRVPYIGRSTGSAAICCHVVDEAQARLTPPGLTSYQPGGGDGAQLLRVPFAGYLDALDQQFQEDRPAWEVSRTIPYRSADAPDPVVAEPEIAPSAYRDFIVLRFQGLRPDGQLAPMFTAALRRAVMAATEDPLPAMLHGHGADGQPHVAFLALPNVDNKHADGHLLGMAIAVPGVDADRDDERRAIVRGVLLGMRSGDEPAPDGRRTLELQVPRIGAVSLIESPGLVRPWGLRPERWGTRVGATRWVSATPVVLDRYPKRGDIEGEIVRSCVELGFPEPEDLVVSTAPLVTGGIQLRPRDLPEKLRGRLFRHVQLDFGRRVSGPVLLGAGRYLGVGLMTPLRVEDSQ